MRVIFKYGEKSCLRVPVHTLFLSFFSMGFISFNTRVCKLLHTRASKPASRVASPPFVARVESDRPFADRLTHDTERRRQDDDDKADNDASQD